MQYNVYINQPSDPNNTEAIAAAIAKRYGVPTDAILKRLRVGRFRVKSNVTLEIAEALAADLTKLGAQCSIEDTNGAPVSRSNRAVSLVPQAAPATTQKAAATASSQSTVGVGKQGEPPPRQSPLAMGTPLGVKAPNLTPKVPPPDPASTNQSSMGAPPQQGRSSQSSNGLAAADPSLAGSLSNRGSNQGLTGLAAADPSASGSLSARGQSDPGSGQSLTGLAAADPSASGSLSARGQSGPGAGQSMTGLAAADPNAAGSLANRGNSQPPASAAGMSMATQSENANPAASMSFSGLDAATATSDQDLGILGAGDSDFQLSSVDGQVDEPAQDAKDPAREFLPPTPDVFDAPSDENAPLEIEADAAPVRPASADGSGEFEHADVHARAPSHTESSDSEVTSLEELFAGTDDAAVDPSPGAGKKLMSMPLVRSTIGMLLCLMVGFVPAHFYASAKEGGAMKSIDESVLEAQSAVGSEAAWYALDDERAALLKDKYAKRDRIAIESTIVWLVVFGALFFVWTRKLPWARWLEEPGYA